MSQPVRDVDFFVDWTVYQQRNRRARDFADSLEECGVCSARVTDDFMTRHLRLCERLCQKCGHPLDPGERVAAHTDCISEVVGGVSYISFGRGAE